MGFPYRLDTNGRRQPVNVRYAGVERTLRKFIATSESDPKENCEVS